MQPIAKDRHGSSQRSSVQKDLWIDKEGQLYHYLMASSDSILHLNQNKHSQTHAVEDMKGITCYLQQKKFYVDDSGKEISKKAHPKQQICVLRINAGKYNYLDNRFSGDDVIINIYEIDGHELTTSFQSGKHLMDGICDNVQFSLDEKNPSLRTQNLVANVHMEQKL